MPIDVHDNLICLFAEVLLASGDFNFKMHIPSFLIVISTVDQALPYSLSPKRRYIHFLCRAPTGIYGIAEHVSCYVYMFVL
jgi:hypothetical protein